MGTASIRPFRGNPYVTITSITPGTIASSRTSCVGVPAFFQLSASAVTAAGTSNPYEDLEYRWAVTSGAEGLHKFTLSWLNQIQDGVTLDTVFDSEVDQVGPEAIFRFYTPGTKVVTLTIRGSDGAGGYITATQTITLTVTAIAATGHFWYDADAGNNANDGKDPWGFNVSGGTFTNATKRLVKTGAFASYNHANAIAPTDLLARFNFIGITGGTGVTAGLYEIAAKISNDEIELTTDIGGTNPANVTSSNGPKQNSSGTQQTSNVVLHFKGGNTIAHTIPTTSNLRSDTNCRFLGYGTSKAYRSGAILYNQASAGQGSHNHCWSWWNLDGGGSDTDEGFKHTASITPYESTNIYLNEMAITGHNDFQLINMDATPGPFGVWNIAMSNLTESNARHCLYAVVPQWLSVMGCSFTGGAHTSATLDHHSYVHVKLGHLLYRWNDFGPGTAGLGRNYCINLSYDTAAAGDKVEFVNFAENNMSGVQRAFDASNTSNDQAELTSKGYVRKMVVEGNHIHGLTGNGQAAFYTADSMTIRDNVWYNNSGGYSIWPVTGQVNLNIKIYRERFHTSQAAASELVYLEADYAATIRDCVFHDTRAAGRVLSVDFADHVARGNSLYTPNNSGNVTHDSNTVGSGGNRSYAQYHVIDPTSQQTDARWNDPANGDFTIPVPTGVAVTALGGGISVQWTNPTGAARSRIGYGTVSGPPYAANVDLDVSLLVTLQHGITGLTPGTLYYVAATQTDPMGWESAYSVQASGLSGLNGGSAQVITLGLGLTMGSCGVSGGGVGS